MNKKKYYFTDKHEYPENKNYQIWHCRNYFAIEIDTYRWLQIPKKEVKVLEKIYKKEGKYFPMNTAYEYKNGDTIMCEYHVDVADGEMLDHYMLEENKIYGGNQSIQFKAKKAKMIHGHDEVAIHQFCFQKKCWVVNGALRISNLFLWSSKDHGNRKINIFNKNC